MTSQKTRNYIVDKHQKTQLNILIHIKYIYKSQLALKSFFLGKATTSILFSFCFAWCFYVVSNIK